MENKERPGVSQDKERLIRPSEPKPEIPREIEGWIEKVEKGDLYLSKTATDDNGQVLVTSSFAKPTKIVLPLSKKELIEGIKEGVGEAVRWLSERCFRLIKIDPLKILFKRTTES